MQPLLVNFLNKEFYLNSFRMICQVLISTMRWYVVIYKDSEYVWQAFSNFTLSVCKWDGSVSGMVHVLNVSYFESKNFTDWSLGYKHSVLIRNGLIRNTSEIFRFLKKQPIKFSKLRNPTAQFFQYKKQQRFCIYYILKKNT